MIAIVQLACVYVLQLPAQIIQFPATPTVLPVDCYTKTVLMMNGSVLINVCGLMQQPVKRAEDAHSREAERRGGQEIPEFTAGVAEHARPTEEQERG